MMNAPSNSTFSLAAIMTLLLSCSALLAQNANPSSVIRPLAEPNIQLTSKETHSFKLAFSALASKAHVTFVIESEPLHLTLAPNETVGLTPGGEPPSSLVPKIAAAYDFDATRTGNIFILTKRFSDPEDIPDVTLAECAQAIDDVGLVLAPFNPQFKRGQVEKSPAMQDLLSSLTSEQTSALQDKKHGLAVASLPPSQQQEAEQLVLFLYVQLPLGNTASAMQQIKSVSGTVPAFCRRNFEDVVPESSKMGLGDLNLFGIEFLDVRASKVSFIPLSKPENIFATGGGFNLMWDVGINGKPDISAPDPTDPAPPTVSVLQSRAVLSVFNSEPLSDIVARLNTRTAGKPKLTVDAALAPKRVALFGEQFTPALKVLDALAELYGLRVRHSDDEKSLRLTRRLFQVPLDPEGLSQAIQAVIPAPLVRARQNYLGRKPSPLHIAAVRALRAVIEPKLKASKTGKVALSDLSSQENMALAAALMSDTAGALEEALSQPLPPGVLNPDLLRLTGTVQEQNGHKTMELFLALPSMESKDTLIMGPGAGNMVIGP